MPIVSRVSKREQAINIAKYYPPRRRTVRKGDFGKLIIAGGSDRYAGCLAFNALAALRAGVDLAIVVAPRRAADIVAGYSPDLITVPCVSAFPDPRVVRELMAGEDALVVGCGVIRTRASHNALLAIIRDCKNPMVVDAEALHAIAVKPGVCKGKQILLTPNAGEFQVLSKKAWPSSREERARAVKTLAKRYSATVIVKGADDYISDGENVYVDHEGCPYLTKGGYGDLLAGVAGAMLARGQNLFDSAKAAAYLVGRAGKIVSEKLGEGTLASDVLEQLPYATIRERASPT
jgi:ADP-dependent NAD(P)H-hydrate dehydratase / NAD(P)H-hydrate epimerase